MGSECPVDVSAAERATRVSPTGEEFDFSKRIPQLDGLRGIAILTVVLYHYAQFAAPGGGSWTHFLTPFTIGWAGVDLFFVLSGFLIGGILLDARGSPSYFPTFYTRRVCRIVPLYFTFLLAAALSWGALRWTIAAPWASFPLFIQNFWMGLRTNAELDQILGITWSLAVEEQFYLTLPIVLYLAKPRHIPKILVAGIAAAPVFRLIVILTSRRAGPMEYFLLPSRMDTLLVGVTTAYLLRQPGARAFLKARRRQLWTGVEILTIFSCLFFVVESYGGAVRNFVLYFVVYDSLALLFAFLIALSISDNRLAHALQRKWLTGLGSIAYGVYLLHPLILRLVARFVTKQRLSALAVTTIVTLLVAKLSWEYFEKPIVRLGHRAVYSQRTELERRVPIESAVGVE